MMDLPFRNKSTSMETVCRMNFSTGTANGDTFRDCPRGNFKKFLFSHRVDNINFLINVITSTSATAKASVSAPITLTTPH